MLDFLLVQKAGNVSVCIHIQCKMLDFLLVQNAGNVLFHCAGVTGSKIRPAPINR